MTVMIVEDDPDVRLGCEQALRLEGMATRAVPSAEAALREVQAGYAGIVVSDIHLPGADGMALLRELMTRDAALPVIMITGHGDVSLAVQAMNTGAYDFLEKPFSPERLVATCRRALDKRRLALEVAELRARLAGREALSARLIGDSPAIGRLRQMIADLADTAANVLIHGETGTGKELVARCLHEASGRRARHFVPINCGGLPEQPVRIGDLRPRGRLVHGRRAAPHRQDRACRRRHAIPRRDREHADADADQAAARAAGARGGAAGLQPAGAGERTRGGGDQGGPARAGAMPASSAPTCTTG